MLRGVLVGGFWGLLVGVSVLAVASLMGQAPQVALAPPEAPVVEVPVGSGFDPTGVDSEVTVVPAQDTRPAVPESVEVAEPARPAQGALAEDVVASSPQPTVSEDVTAALAPPPAGAAGPGVTFGTAPDGPDEDVAEIVAEAEALIPEPVRPATLEIAEATQDAAEISADPLQPSAPSFGGESSGFDVATPGVTNVVPQPRATAQPEQDATVAPSTTETAEAPVVEEEAPEEQVAALSPESQPSPLVTAPEQPVAVAPTPEATRAIIPATPVAQAPAQTEAAEAPAPEAPTTEVAVATEPARAPLPDINALQIFAADPSTYVAADPRPKMSIILIDEGGDAAALPALQNVGIPLTFAVPSGRIEARGAMRTFRAEGHEVVLLLNLPDGQGAATAGAVVADYLEIVPETVAILDGSATGFRGDQRIAEQVAQILDDTGRGLIAFDQGLNTAGRIAAEAGVPVRNVYRDLDANGQSAAVIRRFLDQAAFRADQEGGVVLLGRLRPETISALLIWAQQDRAQRVNIVPLSAMMLDEATG
ncbi:MAG: divergent polysaccharide deacetylase family protein [Shimia sp.]